MALSSLAHRISEFDGEIAELDARITPLLEAHAPDLLEGRRCLTTPGRHHVRTSIPASTPRGGAVLGSRPVLIRPAHQYGAFTRVRRTCRRLAERGHRLIVPTSPLKQVSTHARHQG